MLSVFTDIDETDALLFLGTRHTFDADDAQIFDIERLLTLFQPLIILIEGGEWTEIGATKKVVTAAGEMAFVVQLARLRRIKSESFEPSINDEVLYVLEKHTALDAKLYYALRMATQWSKQAPSLEIDSRMDRLLGIEDLAAMPQLNIAPLNTAQLSVVMTHKFPSVLDWKNLDIWKNGLPVDTDGTDTLDQIRKRSEEFRNKRLLSRIQAHRKAGGKVLVVAGVNHLIALMPFLRGG